MDDDKNTLPPELRARLKQMPKSDVVFVPRTTQAASDLEPVPRHPNKRGWKGRKKPPSKDTFPWLDEHFLEDAKAGISDEELARQSGLSRYTIIRWRRERGITRSPSKNERKKTMALNLFGTDHGDVLHRCDDSPIQGTWQVPEYVLRVPLSYGELCRHLWFLNKKLESSPELLAQAFGIRPRDVETALTVYESFLDKNGRPCDLCGLLCIKTDRYCSKWCWDEAKRKVGDR